MANHYDFAEQLAYSKKQRTCTRLDAILKARIPGYTGLHMAETSDDKAGTDYWAKRLDIPALSIELKARSTDYLPRGYDDLALETWSVLPRADHPGKVGWTRDSSKWTDYVVWYWEPTGRFHIVPFPPLCHIFSQHWWQWRKEYWTEQQSSGGWESECTYVPRDLIDQHCREWASGTVNLKGQ